LVINQIGGTYHCPMCFQCPRSPHQSAVLGRVQLFLLL
jgi:hypothetical protein